MIRFLRSLLRPRVASVVGNVFQTPFPVTPDFTGGTFGFYALAQNINYSLAYGFSPIAVGLSINTIFSTPGSTLSPGIVMRTVTPPGNNDQFPTGAAVAASIVNTLPKDGTLQFTTRYINNGTGQTVTITGNTGLTLTGTMSMINNTWRDFLFTINVNAGTYEITNIGGGTL